MGFILKTIFAVVVVAPMALGWKLNDWAKEPVVTTAKAQIVVDDQELKKAYERGYSDGKLKASGEQITNSNMINTLTEENRRLKTELQRPAPQPVCSVQRPPVQYVQPPRDRREIRRPYYEDQRIDDFFGMARGIVRQLQEYDDGR
jgi:hypothetical protein